MPIYFPSTGEDIIEFEFDPSNVSICSSTDISINVVKVMSSLSTHLLY